MKARNLYRIIIGVLVIISGIVSIIFTVWEAAIGTIVLAAGIVFLFDGISRYRRYSDDHGSDERSKKIGSYGLSYAWLTGLIFMSGLFWPDYLNVLGLSAKNTLMASILVVALSSGVYRAYPFQKGDVEKNFRSVYPWKQE